MTSLQWDLLGPFWKICLDFFKHSSKFQRKRIWLCSVLCADPSPGFIPPGFGQWLTHPKQAMNFPLVLLPNNGETHKSWQSRHLPFSSLSTHLTSAVLYLLLLILTQDHIWPSLLLTKATVGNYYAGESCVTQTF